MSEFDNERSQAPRPPAEVYEEFFVPALFHQWGSVVSDAAGIGPGQRVLDVACGTGALTCVAAERVEPGGSVVGLDANVEMLNVARRKSAKIEWKDGRAESLPFPDESFDAVTSQFGLMFFEDRVAALREMMRALRPGGRLAVAVWDSVDNSPGYSIIDRLLQRLFGDSVVDAFRSPFVLGDKEKLLSLCAEAGLPCANVTRRDGMVRFASIADLVSTERACVWTLGGLLDDDQFELFLKEAEQTLSPFVTADGTVEFELPALIITTAKT